jgi:LacI family transcriptional regulator
MEWHYFRAVATGAAFYARGVPGVNVVIGDRSGLILTIKDAQGPIVSAYAPSDVSQSLLRRAAWPIVNTSAYARESPSPQVIPDNPAIGRMAAEYLLSAGFRDFAFVSQDRWFSEQRLKGFAGVLKRRGLAIAAIAQTELHRTLPGLPKPTALFVDGDRLARQVANQIRAMGIHVPSEIAILGVDNDPLLCEELAPQLSSIDINGERVGFEAARLVFDLLAGATPSSAPILIPPKQVVPRESTEMQAVDSPILARALDIIRQQATHGVTVSEVAAIARVPRRTLHRLCQEHFELPASELIRRQRVEHAKRLLVESDRTIVDIGESCGFSHYGRFHALFHRLTGVTPGAYRRQRRLR